MMNIEKMMTPRLLAAASFVKPDCNIADVGTDHAYIPIWLVQQRICPFAIAMDINHGPLMRAQDNIKRFGLADKIQTRLSDGVSSLAPDEVDTVVICGMGGILINRILENGAHLYDTVRHYVLQPMTAIEETRKYLETHQFLIENERLVKEEDKIYTILSVVPGKMRMEKELDYHVGICLVQNRDPLLPAYLDGRLYELDKAITSMSQTSNQEVLRKREKFISLKEDMKQLREACASW
ncbi:MAG: SAM-dependent methyltransferase [Clostridia bacterium]|nr:SAM-dependent methyltransferase [Clostridia bacterium]